LSPFGGAVLSAAEVEMSADRGALRAPSPKRDKQLLDLILGKKKLNH